MILYLRAQILTIIDFVSADETEAAAERDDAWHLAVESNMKCLTTAVALLISIAWL